MMSYIEQNTLLPTAICDWIAAATSGVLTSARQLSGATSSTLYAIDVRAGKRELPLVLRLFTNAEWVAEDPDVAAHEAAGLREATAAGIVAPDLVAVDETGEFCGVPALLMTRVPGRVDLLPANLNRWLQKLAEAIAPLHTRTAEDFPWQYRPYNDVTHLETPTWTSAPDLWDRVIRIVNGTWPAFRPCLIHRDYHPTNVLWQDGVVSGIVDWPNACRGPAGIDVAWCRMNLADLYGVAAADRFLEAYQAVAGPDSAYHPFWDLLTVIDGLPGPPDVYPPWVEFGVEGLTDALMLERTEAYLRSVLARF